MARYACIKNGVIACFMSGEGLASTDMPSGMDSMVELPEGDWNYGDTIGPSLSDKLSIGQGLPPNVIGKNGMTYIDLATGNVYRKNNNSWFL